MEALGAVLSGESVQALRREQLSRAMKEVQERALWVLEGEGPLGLRGDGAEALGDVPGMYMEQQESQCDWSQVE